MTGWTCAMALDRDRSLRDGSRAALRDAIRRGADLRIATAFRHNEHVDVSSDNPEVVQEQAEFRVTYLVDDRWAAGIMTLRQPVDLLDDFGPRPSTSFFLYNEDGQQAIARPYLDGPPVSGTPGTSPLDDQASMPKYHQLDSWDGSTNAPSSNFVYDFETFRFFVRDEWREVVSHSADGVVKSGSIDALAEAAGNGAEVKVGIRGLCADLAEEGSSRDHEVFVQVHSNYYYTERRLFIGATQPLVRVRPGVPLRYVSRGWDFGWVMARTDGYTARLLVDPYTLRFNRSTSAHSVRWFVR